MAVTQYTKENSDVLKNLFNKTFFNGWAKPRFDKKDEVFQSIEIYLTPECNLGCEYCYVNKFSKDTYPKELRNSKTILNNLRLLLNWLIENKYTPKIDLFSGAGVESELGLEALELILDVYSKVDDSLKPEYISIPTNFTFITDDKITERVDSLMNNFKAINIHVGLSISVDGKYMEQNRPWKNPRMVNAKMVTSETEIRDDEYYDKVFDFAVKYNAGFHPMVYSHNIELWKKNWLWFQEKFEEKGIPFKNIYLLEIRNQEWTSNQILEYTDFLEFIIDWTFEKKFGKDPKKLADFILSAGYNTLRSPFLARGRGTTCSLQTTMFVRLGDLDIIGCHRQSYDGYDFGKFIVEDNKIVDIEAKNLEMAIGILTFDLATQPYCEQCMLKDICSGGCMGAQLETNGDPFIPIPTVCDLLHHKHYTLINKYIELGVYKYMKPKLSQVVITTNEMLYNAVKNEKEST